MANVSVDTVCVLCGERKPARAACQNCRRLAMQHDKVLYTLSRSHPPESACSANEMEVRRVPYDNHASWVVSCMQEWEKCPAPLNVAEQATNSKPLWTKRRLGDDAWEHVMPCKHADRASTARAVVSRTEYPVHAVWDCKTYPFVKMCEFELARLSLVIRTDKRLPSEFVIHNVHRAGTTTDPRPRSGVTRFYARRSDGLFHLAKPLDVQILPVRDGGPNLLLVDEAMVDSAGALHELLFVRRLTYAEAVQAKRFDATKTSFQFRPVSCVRSEDNALVFPDLEDLHAQPDDLMAAILRAVV